jgi:hypothetical protein
VRDMKKDWLIKLEGIFIYFVLGAAYGVVIKYPKQFSIWTTLIFVVAWVIIFDKVNKYYEGKKVVLFNKVNLTAFNKIVSFISFLLFLFGIIKP